MNTSFQFPLARGGSLRAARSQTTFSLVCGGEGIKQSAFPRLAGPCGLAL